MKTITSKTLLFIAIGFLFFTCKKDNQEKNGPYIIEGVMYNGDGVTPLANKKLLLAAYMGGSIGGGANVEWPAEATTNENGCFRFEYEKNGSYQHMQIEQNPNQHPVLGPFLREIPANQNIKKDICVAPRNWVHIKADLQRELTDTDTLFVYYLGYKALNDTSIRYDIKGDPAPIYIYTYTKDKVLENNTWIIKMGYTNYYNGDFGAIRWGLGRDNFEKGIRLTIGQNSGSTQYNVTEFNIKAFPEISHVTLTVK